MRTKKEIETRFASASALDGAKSLFLVGIGGAGMSGLVPMLRAKGVQVSGSDNTASPVTQALEESGSTVYIGHSSAGIDGAEGLVLSDAIPLDESPEVAKAQELGIPLFRRSQVLGWCLGGKKSIAVTGTHGKTTTTSMIALGLTGAGADPTVVVGAEVPQLSGSTVLGSGEFAVIEACEAYDSLRDLNPDIAVLTNLELDHVDFHENWENLREAVVRFANRARVLVYNLDDEGAREVAGLVTCEPVGFRPAAPLKVGETEYDLAQKGAHNIANANAAFAALNQLGLLNGESAKAIASFTGAERRQQVLYDGGNLGDFTLIDDYGHHPTEVAQALRAVKDHWVGVAGRKRLVVVFQPHLYSRTAPLIEEFASALDLADFVVVTDIYPAREAPIPGVSSFRIAEKLTKPYKYVPARQLLPREVAGMIEPGDVIVGMGAGNIAEFGPGLLAERERTQRPKRILVAYGGDSAEREVSINSGRAIFKAAKELGYDAEFVDLSARLLTDGDLSLLTGPSRPDLVLLALHGPRSEDGAMQGLLEMFHVPYTGSGIQASALAMDKAMAKAVLASAGVRLPKGQVVRRGETVDSLQCPLVVKPNNQGSTVGLTFVDEPGQLAAALEEAWTYDDEAMVEERVIGVEISVPVFGDRALSSVEVVPGVGEYDFANKYTPGATEEICPARIPPARQEEVKEIALRCHRALGCRGITRTDMIVTTEETVVLEVNTLPGMTPTSLVPKSAQEAGMSFNDVVAWIIQDGLKG